jgi:hypothetical protein
LKVDLDAQALDQRAQGDKIVDEKVSVLEPSSTSRIVRGNRRCCAHTVKTSSRPFRYALVRCPFHER